MYHRGRGAQEIGPSQNPFFQTTNSLHGPEAIKEVDWDAPAVQRQQSSANQVAKVKEDFSFLYSRTSDVIGSKVPMKQSAISKALDDIKPSPAEIARRRALGLQSANQNAIEFHPEELKKPDAAEILHHYNHEPIKQDPRFSTTSYEYGKNKPTIATFVAERNCRPQGFSQSFHDVKPMNTGLNTSITKSQVHPKLDPEFM